MTETTNDAIEEEMGSPERLRAWAKDIELGRPCLGAAYDLKCAAAIIEDLRNQILSAK